MKFVVIASHSGGHIAPALAFCQELMKKEASTRIMFITTEGTIERKLLTGNAFDVVFFPKKKLSITTVGFLYELFSYALNLFSRMQPDCVIGFGGYISIPFILAASVKKIPRMIHEQNVVMGKANKFLALWTDKIVLSFPNAALQTAYRNKTEVVGIPLRTQLRRIDREKARAFFGLDQKKFTILVTGGSQGAQKINSAIMGMINQLPSDFFQVIHITGSYDYERVKKFFETVTIRHVLYEFFDAMEYAWSACDCVVTRAGANTIAEIMYFGIPAIVIPYPYARSHQSENAKFLSARDAAVVIEDARVSAELLQQQIGDLQNNAGRLQFMKRALEDARIGNAGEHFVQAAFSLVNNKGKK